MTPPSCRPLFTAFAAGILLFAPPAIAHPLDPVPSDHAPNDLGEYLKRLPEPRRVIRLAIAPESVHAWDSGEPDAWSRLNTLFTDANTPPAPTDVLAAFGRQVIFCGTVQVVAPLKRVTINPYPGPPEEWAKVGRERAARVLLGSLSAAQWAQASGDGLSLADLPPAMHPYFLALLPQPFVVEQQEALNEGSYMAVAGAKETTISPNQVRLRLTRSMDVQYVQKDQQGSYWGGSLDGHEKGERFYALQYASGAKRPAETYRERLREVIKIEEPNRLKHGDLRFDQTPLWGRGVSTKGAKTVGDLVQRLAAASGLELYADRRVSGLAVAVASADENASADAADLLKALCYAVCGAVRKVENGGDTVYILTSDREPLAPRRLRLAEWANEVDALMRDEETTFDKTVQKGGYTSAVTFGAGDGKKTGISDALMQRAEKVLADPNRWEDKSGIYKNGRFAVPVSELSPDMQDKVRRDLARIQSQTQPNVTLDDRKVSADFQIKTQLVVSGYGAFDGPSLGNLSAFIPQSPAVPPRLPDGMAEEASKGKMVLSAKMRTFAALAIAADADVPRIAAWAKQHGFNRLLFPVTLFDTDTDRFRQAVAAGKAAGVTVIPEISVGRRPHRDTPDPATPPLAAARNVFGETLREYALRCKRSATARDNNGYNPYGGSLDDWEKADWLDLADDATRSALAARLHAIAQAAGTVIVWSDIAAPGFARSADNYYWGAMVAGDTGYNRAALRIAAIRDGNIDPVDLISTYGLPPYSDWRGALVPYFSDDYSAMRSVQNAGVYRFDKATGKWDTKTIVSTGYGVADAGAWDRVRRDSVPSCLTALRQAANLPPDMTVYLHVHGEFTPERMCAWGAGAVPPLGDDKDNKTPVFAFTIGTWATNPEYRRYLCVALRKEMEGDGKTKTVEVLDKWAGIVVDCTAITTRQAIEALDTAFAPVAPPRGVQ